MEENTEIPLTEPVISDEVTEEESNAVLENEADKINTENNELTEKLRKFELEISSLKAELSSKTDVITDLEKQKSSFEKEVTHVSFHLNFVDSINCISEFPAKTRSRECCYKIRNR